MKITQTKSRKPEKLRRINYTNHGSYHQIMPEDIDKPEVGDYPTEDIKIPLPSGVDVRGWKHTGFIELTRKEAKYLHEQLTKVLT